MFKCIDGNKEINILMIISASRRTDIPTYYSDWFYERIKDGFVFVRNPMNIHQVSKINLSSDVVDGIVFWTKNPEPMFTRLAELKKYPYYFQFTLNAYDKDIETNIPSKNDCIIPTFQKLSRLIGAEKVIWRYDPIFINEKYTFEYHCKYFEILCKKLSGYTEKCTISFIDMYKKTARNMSEYQIKEIQFDMKIKIAQRFFEITEKYGIHIDTCAEGIDLNQFGISHAHCIDQQLFGKIIGYPLNIEKDKNQREECGCIASIDIGTYNTCRNGCRYCYANYSANTVQRNSEAHNPKSPLLFGELGEKDKITVRTVKSCKDCRGSLLA